MTIRIKLDIYKVKWISKVTSVKCFLLHIMHTLSNVVSIVMCNSILPFHAPFFGTEGSASYHLLS